MTRIDGFVLEEPSLDMAATIRFKSLPRIVEKSTRLARDRITTEMQKFGQGRTDAPAEEWSRLEQQVCEAIENRRLAFETCDMAVQDVIGVKLVAPDHRLDEVEQVLCDRGGSAIVQRQEHRGRYNDRQLIVRLPAPSAGPTIDRLRSIDWSAASSRGMRPEDLLRAIPSYVESGSDSVSIEIILTNWEDYVESEFGLSMHEERVVRQRSHDHPGSHVATSIALGLSYLLLVAISPTVEIYQTPIRLSGRYLPETTVGMIAQLFGIEIATSPFWTEDTVVGLALKPANTTSA